MAVGYRGGLITGKIGGDVGYMVKNAKGRTSQGWRAYQAHVSNPNNNAQRFNRVILSTVAKAYSTLRPICDHSFEGIAGKSRNQKEFMKQNIRILQQLAPTGNGNFNPRDLYLMVSNPLLISKGSLPRLSAVWSTSTNKLLIGWPSSGSDEIPTMGQFFDIMGWTDGGQITVLLTGGDDSPEAVVFSYARFVFKLGKPALGVSTAVTRDTPLWQENTSGQDTIYMLAYNLNESENVGNFDIIPYKTGELYDGFDLVITDGSIQGEPLNGYGVINSTLVDGQWKRSTQTFEGVDDGDSNYNLQKAMDSYATVQQSSMYLNHG